MRSRHLFVASVIAVACGTTGSGDGDGDGGSATGGAANGGAAGQTGSAGTPAGGSPGSTREPLVFSVLGDVPYGILDDIALRQAIAGFDETVASEFIFHVGDIKPGADACDEFVYDKVSGLLRAADRPVFMIPGDNEWNDCTDVDEAWGFWQQYFSEFERNWPQAPVVDRQPERPSNFRWRRDDILLVALTMPGGRVWDAAQWEAMVRDGATFLEQTYASNADAAASVVFIHAHPTENHAEFVDALRRSAADHGKPVLLLHGDGHRWIDDRPYPEQNVHRIQVDQGAVPLEVTVDTGNADPFSYAAP